MTSRVAIVGAGPGGLATALLLQGLGFHVTLFEAKDVPGGRMGRLRAMGYSFDTGPTMLQLPAVLAQIFSRAGLRMDDYVELLPVTPNARVHFWDGSRIDMFADAEKNRASWEELVQGGAALFDRFYAEQSKKYGATYEAFIARDANDVVGYLNPLRLGRAARYAPWESLHTQLSRTLSDERLVYALSYPSKYLGLHPTTCSSVFSVIPFLELAFGVHHPKGGFRALADGMLRAFRDLGGTVRLGEPVTRIATRTSKRQTFVEGVALASGEVVPAEEVVVNADWAAARASLLDRDVAVRGRYPERLDYSCSTLMLYLGVEGVFPEAPHHAIYLSEAVRRTDRAALRDLVFDAEDAPFYVCNPIATEPSSAPAGHSALYVLVPAPNTGNAVDWASESPRYAERIIERLRLVGLPDLRERIRYQRVFTAETWRDEFFVHRGAVFNLAHGFSQLGPARPASCDPTVDHLHWVGGGTHPGSGLLTIFESAALAAGSIAASRGLSFPKTHAPTPPPL